MKYHHHIDVKNLRFSIFSAKDIKALSVAKIVTPLVFDQLGHALPGGLYDPKMGKPAFTVTMAPNHVFIIISLFSLFNCRSLLKKL